MRFLKRLTAIDIITMTISRLLLLLCLLTLAPPSCVQNPIAVQQASRPLFKVQIAGTLTDFRDAPIEGATIGLVTWDSRGWVPLAVSSRSGEYSTSVLLQSGEYRLIAALGEFELTLGGRFAVAPRDVALRVDLRVTEYRARSDQAPPTSPQAVSQLPDGSLEPRFAPPPNPKPAPPAPPKPGAQELVSVFFVTNRAPIAGQAAHYLDRPVETGVSYGVCSVSIPPTHKPGHVERPSIWRIERVEDVKQHIVITQRELVPGEQAFRSRLRRAFAESGSEAFLFIHGYNVGFDDAVRRTAQLFRDLEFDGVPILFSWPAQEAWWRYPAAEDVVNASARQLEHFLRNTLADERLSAINVIAHSMGNRILLTALERMALQKANSEFSNIVLAAPDINVADFDAVSKILGASAKRTTIYSSSHDVALLVSKAFHKFPRLGEAPPNYLSPAIDTVDASEIRQDVLGHSYFGDSNIALRDLFLLLRQGLEPQKRFLQARELGGLRYWSIPPE